jgi:predicted nucleic acid-binding protein
LTVRAFIDTNVLIYADDLDSGVKNRVAQQVLRGLIISRGAVVSTQVLQEYFVVATRKLGVPPKVARKKIGLLSTLEVAQVDLAAILGAIDLLRLHSLSFWDALIVRSAATAGCTALLTEDLQHGQVIEGVRVENPFRSEAKKGSDPI